MTKIQKQSSSQNLSLEMNRISALPMPIIYHILSFLPTKEVVRTCVISKRWINIWSSVPSFHFTSICFPYTKTFIKFVDSVLFLRDGSDMQNVSLSIVGPIDDVDVSRIKEWITYAVRHNVQVLDIENTCWKNIQLTPHLFTCESLREFKLLYNSLSLPLRIWLPSLKVVHLIFVSLKDGQLYEALFSASPSLETLILENCNITSGILTISASQLKNLNLKGNFPSSIVVSALNLISLKLNITNSVPVNIIFNGNLKLISDANIDLKGDSSVSTTQLISIVKNVRYLTVSTLFVRSIAVELQKDLATQKCSETPFSNLKWLKIGTLFSKDEVILINHILMHSTEIESIFLVNDVGKFGGLKNIAQVEQYEVKEGYKYKLSHLKFVEIEGFRGSENEMELVNLFLENAIVLEKMIIFLRKSGECSSIDEQELMKVANKQNQGFIVYVCVCPKVGPFENPMLLYYISLARTPLKLMAVMLQWINILQMFSVAGQSSFPSTLLDRETAKIVRSGSFIVLFMTDQLNSGIRDATTNISHVRDLSSILTSAVEDPIVSSRKIFNCVSFKMTPPGYLPLSDINYQNQNCRIKFRVSRKWSIGKELHGKPSRFDMVLIDDKGNQVHAIVPKNQSEKFSEVIREGCVYHAEHFNVQTVSDYRLVQHAFVILFKWDTFVRLLSETAPEIPPYKFAFTEFDNINSRYKQITNLIGISAITVRKGMKQLRNIHLRNDSPKNKTIELLEGSASTDRISSTRQLKNRKTLSEILNSLDVKLLYFIITSSLPFQLFILTLNARYQIQARIQYHTNRSIVTIFGKEAETLVKHPASELEAMLKSVLFSACYYCFHTSLDSKCLISLPSDGGSGSVVSVLVRIFVWTGVSCCSGVGGRIE
ncbi:hypothetical protein IFM89_007935 [Coptis chinensis]|uniref:F-box domain-containing protein n=1 Tax=Coptis chinensis TaxID=261450 RepID=A0A835MAB1_9MAGN|nr:hypothetical protein IFM89_007935 [Coptis chinensis]